MSEDCLSLNVWTPAVDGGRRPVVVFLHGGGVVAGSGSAPLFDGGRLASRGDLVVVTINFRLGALGSLFAPERVGVDGDRATNLALRDQLMALRWVRDEIGAFGGDPSDVTVMGQSSGAVAIACMLTGQAASGLFDRAILQSGGLERVRSTEAARDVARQFFAALGDDDRFDRLRPSVEEILDAQAQIPTGFVPPEGPFHHAVDGELIPEHPLVAAGRRPLPPVPILAGTTRDEWRIFDAVLDDDEVTDGLLRERVRALAGGRRRCRRGPRALPAPSSPVTPRSPAGGPWRARSSPTSTSARRPSSSCGHTPRTGTASTATSCSGHRPGPGWVPATTRACRWCSGPWTAHLRSPERAPTPRGCPRPSRTPGSPSSVQAIPRPRPSGTWPAYDADDRATMLLGAEPQRGRAPPSGADGGLGGQVPGVRLISAVPRNESRSTVCGGGSAGACGAPRVPSPFPPEVAETASAPWIACARRGPGRP